MKPIILANSIDLCLHIYVRMVTHATELLTTGSDEAENLLRDERHNLGEISLEELNRIIYAQGLASHALTWQVSTFCNITE